ncbi:MAG: hypothetical protein V4664_02905 [Patescibacteria group bacterium]
MIRVYEDGKLMVRVLITILFVFVIIGYSIFQAHNIVTGPEIVLNSISSGDIVTDQAVNIGGVAKNISFISLDDRPIFIDESGQFKEKLLLYPGYNIIRLYARDKFGTETEKQIELIYQPPTQLVINQ